MARPPRALLSPATDADDIVVLEGTWKTEAPRRARLLVANPPTSIRLRVNRFSEGVPRDGTLVAVALERVDDNWRVAAAAAPAALANETKYRRFSAWRRAILGSAPLPLVTLLVAAASGGSPMGGATWAAVLAVWAAAAVVLRRWTGAWGHVADEDAPRVARLAPIWLLLRQVESAWRDALGNESLQRRLAGVRSQLRELEAQAAGDGALEAERADLSAEATEQRRKEAVARLEAAAEGQADLAAARSELDALLRGADG